MDGSLLHLLHNPTDPMSRCHNQVSVDFGMAPEISELGRHLALQWHEANGSSRVDIKGRRPGHPYTYRISPQPGRIPSTTQKTSLCCLMVAWPTRWAVRSDRTGFRAAIHPKYKTECHTDLSGSTNWIRLYAVCSARWLINLAHAIRLSRTTTVGHKLSPVGRRGMAGNQKG